MSLFDFRRLFVSDSEIPGKSIFPIPYSKVDDIYNVKDDYHLSYLKKIQASSKIGDTFLRFEEDKIYVYVCFGDQSKSEKEKVIFNISKAGANCYKAVSYLNEYLNFYIEEENFEEKNYKEDYVRYFISGIILSSYKYEFNSHKDHNHNSIKEPNNDNPNNKDINSNFISIIGNQNVKNFIKIYNSQNFARFLGDTPANQMTPTKFVEYAKEYFKNDKNINIEILNKEDISKLNMKLLLSVSQGSIEAPKLLNITYKNNDNDKLNIGLVGKGITFDSGGISLKPSMNMSAMKGDMLGGASVLAVMKLISEFNLKGNVKAIIPLTENLPSGSATKPGDVFYGMSGKSVEVDNTDAEGRLILADALTYCCKFKPEFVLDMATLTGAMSISLGDSFIGFFSNNDFLSKIIIESGEKAGDPTWRMPLSSLYLNSMKSLVADIKNSGGRQGGSAMAAIFLKEFVEDNVKWAHFDIAGVMDSSNNSSVYGKYMTGKGVPVMFETVRKIIEKE
ncbi:cytosol aminopeptidase [Nosema bombycis CQ1]|uniref:leucyl aminopeptidase n=1 Tax=Nosema bombycis (strain CQ1 / CVCC 102059) TaxID=578461 RepID=R0KUY5_NOSB1|nr:cytosol aminopeptidase [Nosema bombycis CQ1]|eukprot:EOB14027.1 cytosol aminopeptidase [Nosema bombycis CQ1]